MNHSFVCKTCGASYTNLHDASEHVKDKGHNTSIKTKQEKPLDLTKGHMVKIDLDERENKPHPYFK